MKKNDAIYQLAGYLSTQKEFTHRHPEELKELAEHVLIGVEKLGMLPPGYIDKSVGFVERYLKFKWED